MIDFTSISVNTGMDFFYVLFWVVKMGPFDGKWQQVEPVCLLSPWQVQFLFVFESCFQWQTPSGKDRLPNHFFLYLYRYVDRLFKSILQVSLHSAVCTGNCSVRIWICWQFHKHRSDPQNQSLSESAWCQSAWSALKNSDVSGLAVKCRPAKALWRLVRLLCSLYENHPYRGWNGAKKPGLDTLLTDLDIFRTIWFHCALCPDTQPIYSL